MATNCIVDDYVLRRRTSMLFGEINMADVISKWDLEDDMLISLDRIEVFSGIRKWSQLDPLHWRLLICNTMNQRDKYVDPDKFNDDSEKIVATLYFMIMGLIHCMQLRSTGAVDNIRVMRISEIDVTFEFIITMIPEKKKQPPPSGLQVVVDNTIPK